MSFRTQAKKVAVIGPESTGKTLLVEKLADYYDCNFVLEYAREYVESLNTKYTFEDILTISRKQRELEKNAFRMTKKLLICDTSMITNKIWIQDKFGKCDPWIEKEMELEAFDLFLLCKPDLQWEHDAIREDSERREYLFDIYIRSLIDYKFHFKVVSGVNASRTEMAINYVDELFSTL